MVGGLLNVFSRPTGNRGVPEVGALATNGLGNVVLANYGRDRERGADLFASVGALRDAEATRAPSESRGIVTDAVDNLGECDGGVGEHGGDARDVRPYRVAHRLGSGGELRRQRPTSISRSRMNRSTCRSSPGRRNRRWLANRRELPASDHEPNGREPDDRPRRQTDGSANSAEPGSIASRGSQWHDGVPDASEVPRVAMPPPGPSPGGDTQWIRETDRLTRPPGPG